jgi:hypothetical protein
VDILNHREGGMVFYRVFLLSPLQCTQYSNCTVKTVRGCMGLKNRIEIQRQCTYVEINVNGKEENSYDFCLDFAQEFGL